MSEPAKIDNCHSTINKLALISVSDKTGILDFGRELHSLGFALIASGGTGKALRSVGIPVRDVSDLTGFPELIGGRVKTLHPTIHAGILCQMTKRDLDDLKLHGIQPISVVVCNLYPFEELVKKAGVSIEEAVENIDIGGVTLLRAAAKNHTRVLVVCDPADYKIAYEKLVEDEWPEKGLGFRQQMAVKAFQHTCNYDRCISQHFSKIFNVFRGEKELRYGMNPHQKPAFICPPEGLSSLPFSVINGDPGYINLLDALNAYQLVYELSMISEGQFPAAASFKHVSPAGAALGLPLSVDEAKVYLVDDMMLEMTPMAAAYARARGADRMSSFGDFIALSHLCDEATAKIIGREVSDGIIAPSYSNTALEILKKKKNGKFVILLMKTEYMPPEMESRTVYGLTLAQKRNDALIDESLFSCIVSDKKALTPETKRDLLIAAASAKYTQSNSIIIVYNGQVIGTGAGQQSRIHCTQLACQKALNWWLRFHPKVLSLKFKAGVKRSVKSNVVESFLAQQLGEITSFLEEEPIMITSDEKAEWKQNLKGASLCSDAFFPFRDCVDLASEYGIENVISPCGSVNDEEVIKAANEHGMVFVQSKFRLFHH
ncbi:unnamed protein product [Darwinula stevensoni]|uniref:Bifunctional purine biosynthesis protein ATIC n=1 Tax=Darwinula stevensoni TaxID=69355 RepID=A0A7R9FQT8_9CRUS|nr:unnamed protein product [Darwinula stevensoni]CAG0900133.1 unnamed protein product [Darwinula stevensoni]